MNLEGENSNFTEAQRNKIYKDMLMPLKLKISQILLYDTQEALKFLQKYNEIVENEEIIGNEIIQRIVELELEIQTYMRTDGKDKLYDEQSTTLMQQIDDLQIHYTNLSLEDFEQQLQDIKNIYYTNSVNYTFQKREVIERKINFLQANLIMVKAKTANIDEIKKMISEDNKEGLTMYVYNELSNIMQDKNRAMQKIANQLKMVIAREENFLYDSRTWKLLESAQKTVTATDKEPIENKVNLPVAQKKRKNNSFLDLIFGNKIKVGDKEMKIKKTIYLGNEEIKIKELSKIDINWLASNVSIQMLEEIEQRRLEKEGKKAVEIYIPDPRTPIYDFMLKNGTRKISNNIVFFNEEGTKINMQIRRSTGSDIYDVVHLYGEEGANLESYIMYRTTENIINVIEYAKFIDSIIESNLEQELVNEIGVYFEKASMSEQYVDHIYEIIKLPIFTNLLNSYENVKKEYKDTKINYRGQEKAKRERFYQQSKFRESLLIEDKESIEKERKRDKKHRKDKKTFDIEKEY